MLNVGAAGRVNRWQEISPSQVSCITRTRTANACPRMPCAARNGSASYAVRVPRWAGVCSRRRKLIDGCNDGSAKLISRLRTTQRKPDGAHCPRGTVTAAPGHR